MQQLRKSICVIDIQSKFDCLKLPDRSGQLVENGVISDAGFIKDHLWTVSSQECDEQKELWRLLQRSIGRNDSLRRRQGLSHRMRNARLTVLPSASNGRIAPKSADTLAADLCRVGTAALFRTVRNEIQKGWIEP